MWQNILVFLVVLICILVIGRRFYRQTRDRGGACGCGSSGCALPLRDKEKPTSGCGCGQP